MIEGLKKNLTKKNLFAYVIFGAIIIVFVFFGFVGSGSRGGAGLGYAARVNDKMISLVEYDSAVKQMTDFYSNLFGGQMTKTDEDMQRIRNSALDQLIQKEVVYQGAVREGFRVSNAEIRDLILKVPGFQKDGVFQRSYYEGYLRNVGTSASRFEDQLRRDIIMDRVRKTFSDELNPLGIELEKIKQLKSKGYVLEYVKLDGEGLKSRVNVSASDTKGFLEGKDNVLRVQLEFERFSGTKYKDKKLEEVQSDIAKELLRDDLAEKKAQEIGLKIGHIPELEKEINDNGLIWKTTSAVSMDQDRVPEIGSSEKLIPSIYKLTKKGEYLPEVISTDLGSFIVRLKEIRDLGDKTALSDGLKEQLGAQRFNEIFSKWTTSLSKRLSIEKNNYLVNQGVE